MKILPAVSPLRNQEAYILQYIPGSPIGHFQFNNTVLNFPNFSYNDVNHSYPTQEFCLHLWYNTPKRDKTYGMYIDVPGQPPCQPFNKSYYWNNLSDPTTGFSF